MSDLIVVQKLDALAELKARRDALTAEIDAKIAILEADIKAQAQRSDRNFAGCALQVTKSVTLNWDTDLLAGMHRQVPGLKSAQKVIYDTAKVKALAAVHPCLMEAATEKVAWSIRATAKK